MEHNKQKTVIMHGHYQPGGYKSKETKLLNRISDLYFKGDSSKTLK